MLKEWDDIHAGAKADPGVLSTEINHAVGEDAVLVHHVFKNPDALAHYFSTTAPAHVAALTAVAKPELHIVRGVTVPTQVTEVIPDNVPLAVGEYLFGYVKHDYRRPDPSSAINVTAKWTCNDEDPTSIDDLQYWWQMVGTDAFSMEEGLIRIEAYRVPGESALIIHETFEDSKVLKFHLTKGTADKYKKDLDKISTPEAYFFRGPVSWTIRTYSKFMHLPATYTSKGNHYTQPGGTMSDGTT